MIRIWPEFGVAGNLALQPVTDSTVTVWPEYGYKVVIDSYPSDEFVVRLVPYLQGEQGPPGDAAVNFVHQQTIPATMWTVNHNKGYRPIAAVYSPGWLAVSAQVLHISENQLTVEFNTPQTGYVVC